MANGKETWTRRSANLLVVDDSEEMRKMLAHGLGVSGYRVIEAASGEEALASLASVDAVLTDLRMTGMSGIDLLRKARELAPDVPVILLTAFGDVPSAIEAVRAGAYDFLAKPVRLDVLRLALDRALDHRAIVSKLRELERRGAADDAHGLLGESPEMNAVRDFVRRIADSDSSVLLTGESGTGKEVVARALHEAGARRARPFVAINCAALPETLLESELFGHVKGAFTDARSSRAGLLVRAGGGTLFLDEIGELPLPLQAKLLRALQERVVRPLGGDTEVPFDVRLVAATNRDLDAAVEEGRFRNDLYFRINVIEIALPPLRSRGADILLLARHFLHRFAERAKKPVPEIAAEAAERLLGYRWPGNVRELENTMERAIAVASTAHIRVVDLPEKIRDERNKVAPGHGGVWITLEEMERRYILDVLEACGGSRTLAARTLGLDRTTLWRKLERYEAAARRARER